MKNKLAQEYLNQLHSNPMRPPELLKIPSNIIYPEWTDGNLKMAFEAGFEKAREMAHAQCTDALERGRYFHKIATNLLLLGEEEVDD